MIRYLRLRVVSAIIVLIGVSIITFFMIHLLPGDPVQYMFSVSQGESPTPEQIALLRHQLGLDQSLPAQYFDYVSGVFTGDLGDSIVQRRPVTSIIASNVPYTFELTVGAMLVAIVFGLSLGILAAAKRGTPTDTAVMAVSLGGLSMPYFWLAILLILLFSIRLQWLPATGTGSGVDTLHYLVLPSIALGITSGGIIARLVRSSMLEVLNQEYILVARAKGVSNQMVLLRHALRNALIPAITIVGLQFSRLLGGAVVTEIVFARKGLGAVLVDAILNHDFKLVQGILLFIAATYVVINIIIDLSYAIVDPRIRYT